MPTSGQTLSHPITGETLTFVRTAADTDGAAVVMDFEVTGGGAPAAAHVHPLQTETFVVHEGRVRVMLDGADHEAGPGETVVIPPGTPHWWTAVTDLRVTVTLEPALRADEFFEDLFALAEAGLTNAKGLPTPLHFAVLADDYRGLIHLAALPAGLQRVAFAVLAKLGRALGRGPQAARTVLA